jgi:hypothetical protein
MAIIGKTVEESNTFIYFRCTIFHEGKRDLKLKTANFIRMFGVMNQSSYLIQVETWI